MIINPGTLRGIFVAFNTLFNKAFEEQKPLYEQIATVIPSTTDAETYAWLGDIPGMREWIGDREIQNLSGSGYTIKNESFELTIGIPRECVDDDKLGLYGPSVQIMAQSAAMKPDELIFKLLAEGFHKDCCDDEPFFSKHHQVGERTVSNCTNAPLSMESYIAARTAMISLTNSKGRPLGLIPDTLVVPPALDSVARDILVADFINGTKNTMQGTAKPLMVPQLSGNDTAWYLLCTSRPIKPLIYQKRKEAKFVSKTADTDDNVFFSKQFIYGVDSRGNVGYGFWQMAYGSTGTGGASVASLFPENGAFSPAGEPAETGEPAPTSEGEKAEAKQAAKKASAEGKA